MSNLIIFVLFFIQVIFPSVADASTVLSAESLQTCFDAIAAEKTKVLFSFVTGHAVKYMVAEATMYVLYVNSALILYL